MSDVNVVTISIPTYNAIEQENFRYSLFLDNLLQEATLSDDHQSLMFDSEKVNEAIKFCYLERYKKKLATLKTQNSKYGDKK
jgi:hypothetical protein